MGLKEHLVFLLNKINKWVKIQLLYKNLVSGESLFNFLLWLKLK